MYYPRFTKVIIHHFLTQDKTVSWRNKIGMHTSKDEYLINTLRFVSAKEESQIYGSQLPKSMTNLSSEDPTKKSKRVKRSAKKSTKAPAGGVVIRETPEIPLNKKKEKVDVARGNDEDDSNNEQDSSGEDSDQENDIDDNKSQSDDENESDSDHETEENESGLESDQEENEEDEDDEEEVKDEFVKTPSNDSDDEDETKIADKAEVDTDKGFVQEEGTDPAMTNVQQGNENSKILQVIEDANVTLSTVPQKTEVPVTSSSHSSDLAANFLNFSDIPRTDAEVVSPMDVHVNHEVPSQQTPKLLIVPVSVISDSSPVFSTMNIWTQGWEQPEEVSNCKDHKATPEHRECYEGLKKSYDLDKTIFSTYEEPEFEVADSDTPQDQEENPGNNDEEPKEKVASKRDWFTKPTQPQEPTWYTPQQGQNQSWLMTLASSANKPLKTFDELMSTPIDFSAFIMNGLKINNLTQETLLGPAFRLLKGTCSNYAELEYDFEECYKALSEKLDWENPEGGDYPFDLTKPLPLVMSGNHQKVPVDYFFNNDLKYLQGGVSTMTYTTSFTKTKATQYDLPGIEDMVPNIWVPVKVAYDKHVLWGISHWREQHKTFYGYARGLQSTHDVYSTKRILAVTQVEEGDFPCLRINDIDDILLLVVQNWLTNLSSDEVSDFAIALRMPETTKSGIKKRDPYTPYQDPQGFIYVDNNGRNRLMRSDELYKFSDRTLTMLRTSLDEITKNIRMEYLLKRR
ncbi:hypothetical protein Tco_0371081 [Tanacetum coccineum]